MWRETDFHDDEGGRSRRRHISNGQRPREGSHGDSRLDHRFASPDHADGARHAASPSSPPPVHSWPSAAPQDWQNGATMPPAYEPPPEPSGLWETIKMVVILGLTIGGTLYGVYALNVYLDSQHKEVPVYGDTAAPPPGRGTGPPSITWGGNKH